jgi:preprotein translocase subunit SecG
MWLHKVLTGVQVLCSLVIIGLVLIQRGKGADAGAGFGAGASGTVFGARGAGTALSRATAIAAAVFMLNSLALAYFGTQKAQEPKTILDQPLETTAPPARTGAPVPSTPAPSAPAAPGSAPLPAAPSGGAPPAK